MPARTRSFACRFRRSSTGAWKRVLRSLRVRSASRGDPCSGFTDQVSDPFESPSAQRALRTLRLSRDRPIDRNSECATEATAEASIPLGSASAPRPQTRLKRAGRVPEPRGSSKGENRRVFPTGGILRPVDPGSRRVEVFPGGNCDPVAWNGVSQSLRTPVWAAAARSRLAPGSAGIRSASASRRRGSSRPRAA